MKILLVNATLVHGGTQRVISELANQWAKDGYEVTLVLVVGGEIFYDLDNRIKIVNLNFKYKSKLGKLINELRCIFNLRREIIKRDPKFILSFVTQYNIMSIIACFYTKYNVFVSDRSSPRKKLPYIHSFLRKILYKYAKGIISQTNLAKSILTQESKNKNIKVIPNPVKALKLQSNLDKQKVILNIGRLVETKGQADLIQAFSRLTDSSWSLVFLGDGPDMEKLINLSQELGVYSRISFVGPTKDIDYWLSISSIFAFTSFSEGFPNALAEALSAGLACISYNCVTGPSDLITNKINGILVPVGEVNLLIDNIELLINNNSLRDYLSENARETGCLLNKKVIADTYLNFCLGRNLSDK